MRKMLFNVIMTRNGIVQIFQDISPSDVRILYIHTLGTDLANLFAHKLIMACKLIRNGL